MRRTIIYLAILMPVCLVFVPQQTQLALSIGPQIDYLDDGERLPSGAGFESLAEKDPVSFLDFCLKKQHREVQGYSGVLHKQERIKGKDNAPEVIDFWFREQPYSVLLKWREGARDGKGSLFVRGENNNRIAVLANMRIPLSIDIPLEGTMAQKAGRYCINEFSIRQATERTLSAWKVAKENGSLNVEFLGKKPVPELQGRTCFLLKRTCNPPEEEGTATVEIAIDEKTWMQTGSTLRGEDGHLIGTYQFTDLQINPEFAPDLFTRASLKK
jgi:uncharacterized protein DUF1571